MSCVICETRRPRRYCPGVRGNICAPCCGAGREVTVDCPFDCEFLIEGRKNEKPPRLDPQAIPHKEIRVTDSFLEENEELFMFFGAAILKSAIQVPGASDHDVGEALDSLVRTYITLQSGLYYESLPDNPLAAAIHKSVQAEFARTKEERQRASLPAIRDAAALGILVFLRRLAYQRNNGRAKGRAFLHMLHNSFGPVAASAAEPAQGSGSSPLIIT